MGSVWFSGVWVMTLPENVRVSSSTLKLYVIVTSLTVAGIGIVVLIGWFFNIPVLESIVPGLATMKANTALCFALAGSSLWLLQPEEASIIRKRIGKVLAGLILAIGVLTLSQY